MTRDDSIRLRRATIADAEPLARGVIEGVEDYPSFAPPGWTAPSLEAELKHLREVLADPDVYCLIAESEGAVLGQITLLPAARAPHPVDDSSLAHISNLFVRRDHWGFGLAVDLHRAAVEAAAARGFTELRLFVAAGQARARRFYEREGWLPAGDAFDDPIPGLTMIEYRTAVGTVRAGDRSARINRANWDERAPAHAASPGYARRQFIDDPSFLSAVVRFDLPRLGDVRGARGVHLQCHIGTDTISLARLGAVMTGVDFSPASLAEARRLSSEVSAGVEFVEADVYDAVAALGGRKFDLVFTGIGALCWLPSVSRWAAVVAELLRPGGRLFIREGHPMMWSLDESHTDSLVVDYDYFERPEPMVFDEQGTYVETETQFRTTVTHVWNHGLGEIVTALLDAGMELTGLVEHDSVPWEALPGQMEQTTEHEWRVRDRPWRLPHSYTLQAVKRE